mmetsp:Transcript_12441/g.29163  ORF Transcript_12441/g.29163 Transcript_12441/m.29163 type:complete len:87 (-) Transcript_12441:70-330(-)
MGGRILYAKIGEGGLALRWLDFQNHHLGTGQSDKILCMTDVAVELVRFIFKNKQTIGWTRIPGACIPRICSFHFHHVLNIDNKVKQ